MILLTTKLKFALEMLSIFQLILFLLQKQDHFTNLLMDAETEIVIKIVIRNDPVIFIAIICESI